eukprot:10821184-Alexandrium_andersonii.AAC.1
MLGAGGISEGTSTAGGSTGPGGLSGLPAFPLALALGEGRTVATGVTEPAPVPPALGGERKSGGAALGS